MEFCSYAPAAYQNTRVESRAGTSKAIFAYYMVGMIKQEHAHQDNDDAKAMGLDGFALNIGDQHRHLLKKPYIACSTTPNMLVDSHSKSA